MSRRLQALGKERRQVAVDANLLPSPSRERRIGADVDDHQTALCAVTFCSWDPVITMEGMDRFVDRAICANSAIRAIGGTAPWYPCR